MKTNQLNCQLLKHTIQTNCVQLNIHTEINPFMPGRLTSLLLRQQFAIESYTCKTIQKNNSVVYLLKGVARNNGLSNTLKQLEKQVDVLKVEWNYINQFGN